MKMNVFVIGTGTMGSGIAQCFAGGGYATYLYDLNPIAVERSLATMEKILTRQVEKGRISAAAKLALQNNLHRAAALEEAADCELVLEAVVEKMEVKRELFHQLDLICSPQTIFASNTSSLSITEMASGVQCPQRVVGMHFFNPAPVMKLVEIVRGSQTSEATIQSVRDLCGKLDKQAVLVEEAPGFVVNRILIPMINEAIGILAEGIASAADIDTAMQLGANHPMGPLALADLIGLDVVLDIMEVLQRETGDDKYRPQPYLRKMVRAGKLGRKSRAGFFLYEQQEQGKR